MTRLPRRIKLLLVVVAAQVVLLIGMAVLHGARLADGTVVRVEVRPLDPLDPARGAYSDLSYPFQQLPVPSGAGDAYVLLERPAEPNGVWRTTRVTDDQRDLQQADAWISLSRSNGALDVSPIGTYYASTERSQALDEQLAESGGVARLSLDEDGNPTLVDVMADD
ncbi:MAG: GDYXXLXY domain-containing protein [Thermoleophilia bacterium]|nr:GDYXXLXY domain-containing protein [Thermoleophilia bacterium]